MGGKEGGRDVLFHTNRKNLVQKVYTISAVGLLLLCSYSSWQWVQQLHVKQLHCHGNVEMYLHQGQPPGDTAQLSTSHNISQHGTECNTGL